MRSKACCAVREIVLATRNAGKLQEMGEFALPWGVRFVALPQEISLPPETGKSYLENAQLKARAAHLALGRPVLSDDSGLEVAALGGGPGIYSARFAGEHADAAANNALLMERLRGAKTRQARFRAVLVLKSARGEWTTEGAWEGEILKAPRGCGGFGYDPLFYLPELGRTAGELTRVEKSSRSHRGQALRRMLELLRDIPEL